MATGKQHLALFRKMQEWLIALLLLSITLVIFANVVLRYFFGSSLSWAEEYGRYALIWLTLIGTSVCVHKGLHIAVDVWGNKLPPWLAAFWEGAVNVFSAIACLGVTWFALSLVQKSWQTGQKTVALGLPMWFMYGAIVAGMALAALQYLLLAAKKPNNSSEINSHDEKGNPEC